MTVHDLAIAVEYNQIDYVRFNILTVDLINKTVMKKNRESHDQ